MLPTKPQPREPVADGAEQLAHDIQMLQEMLQSGQIPEHLVPEYQKLLEQLITMFEQANGAEAYLQDNPSDTNDYRLEELGEAEADMNPMGVQEVAEDVSMEQQLGRA